MYGRVFRAACLTEAERRAVHRDCPLDDLVEAVISSLKILPPIAFSFLQKGDPHGSSWKWTRPTCSTR